MLHTVAGTCGDAASMTMLAKTGTTSSGLGARQPRDHGIECTQLALDALLAAQAAATRRPPFRVTPAHLLVGLMRQRRSGAGELLATTNLGEDRVWAAFDYRKRGFQGVRRLRDPILGGRPRWTRAARGVIAAAERASRSRETAVVDTIDLLHGIADVGDPFAAHLLSAARVDLVDEPELVPDAHRVELERSPTTQLPSFTALRKLHA